jgi:parallel beta-helix repeat protein
MFRKKPCGPFAAAALIVIGSAGACSESISPTAPVVVEPPAGPGGGATSPTAATYYVSPQGDDGAGGGTPETAFRTLARALTALQAGDTLSIAAGTYEESLRATLRGAAGSPITLRGDGGTPVLSGGRRLDNGLRLEESAHVVVDNLEIEGYTDIGLTVVLGSDIVLRRLRVHNNGFQPRSAWVEGYGMHLDESSNLTVEDCDVYANGPAPRSPIEVGTGINGFALRDSVIRKNRSYANNGGGILVEDSFGVLVEGNEVYGNDLDVSADGWWDGGIWLDGGGDVTISNNVFRDNLGPGIQISDEDRQNPAGYVLEGNVSTGNYYGIFIWNFGGSGFPPASVLRRSGNAISGNARLDVWIEPWR